MTTAEAIAILDRMQDTFEEMKDPEVWEPQIIEDALKALDMAIEALSSGMVYRQDAIDKSLYTDGFNDGYAQCKRDTQDTSAQPNLQPTCNNLAIDCISRKAAIDVIRKLKAIIGTSDDEILLIDKAEAMTELMMMPSIKWLDWSEI